MQENLNIARQAATPSGQPIEPEMNPGDQVPPGTSWSRENICPQCHGSGIRDDGKPCDHCRGTGKVSEGTGGV